MKYLLIFSLIFNFCAFPLNAEARPIKGKYELIGPMEKIKKGQIEMIEFFNYSCGHCYRFLETSKRLHKKFNNKLHHIKYPVYWGNQTSHPARAFYIADDLGLEKQITQELFNTNFKLSINIFQPKVVNFLALDLGIAKEMQEGMKSKKIEARVNRGLALAKQFKANETPTLIINRVLKVTPKIGGGDVDKMTDNLEIIFKDLLTFK